MKLQSSIKTQEQSHKDQIPVVLPAKLVVLVLNRFHGSRVARLEVLQLGLRVTELGVGGIDTSLEIYNLLLPCRKILSSCVFVLWCCNTASAAAAAVLRLLLYCGCRCCCTAAAAVLPHITGLAAPWQKYH
jgi:hypothetical protein